MHIEFHTPTNVFFYRVKPA